MCNFPESSFFDPPGRRRRSGQEEETSSSPVGEGSFRPDRSEDQVQSDPIELTLEEVQAILTTGSTVTSTQSLGSCVKKEPSDDQPTSSRMLLVQSTQVWIFLFFFVLFFPTLSLDSWLG